MKLVTVPLLITVVALQSGCIATQVEKLRTKIPAGHADTLNAKVTTLGGWGGMITGKNIDSDGKGHLSADEYSESITTPWVTTTVDLTGSSIGKPKLQVKPAAEVVKP